MHAAAIRAQAEAELAALHGWPQPVRCRSGAHVGGPHCHEHTRAQPHHHLAGTDVSTELDAATHQREGLHAIPLEVWAARR